MFLHLKIINSAFSYFNNSIIEPLLFEICSLYCF